MTTHGSVPPAGLALTGPPLPPRRFFWPTPVLLRVLTALAVLLIVVLAVAVSSTAGDMRIGMRRIGGRTAPQSLAATGLYEDLSAMDSALRDTLNSGLIRDEKNRREAVARFHRSLAGAHADLRGLAATTGGDPAAQRELRRVMDALTTYQALAGQLFLLAEQASGERPGRLPELTSEPGEDRRRQAGVLMDSVMLPSTQRLAYIGARDLDRTYWQARNTVQIGLGWIAALCVGLVAVLLALQVTLARRQRRLLNPPLALATLLACGVLVVSAPLLVGSQDLIRSLRDETAVAPRSSLPAPASRHAAWLRADALDGREEIRALERWEELPPAGAVALAVLVLAGIRPRLAEFR
jgi:hypothetical protein